MSARIYVHDRHGRQINGDERVQKARALHRCQSYACSGIISPGEWYGIATLYPSDEDFNWLDRETLKPSNTAVRMKVCVRCMTDEKRDLIDALRLDVESGDPS